MKIASCIRKDNNSCRGKLTSVRNYYHRVTGNLERTREKRGEKRDINLYRVASCVSVPEGLDASYLYAKIREGEESERERKEK